MEIETLSPPVAAPAAIAPPKTETGPPPRLVSVDAYRGLVMFLMLAEVIKSCKVSSLLPKSVFWKTLCFHQSHMEWVGCALHDMIQPSFSFLVGVALPFSIASRASRQQAFPLMLAHAFWRGLVLVLLGIFLRSQYYTRTTWGFEDTLSQIGLGYPLLFLLGFRPVRDQWIAVAVLVLGYWAAFALYPLPAAGFDYASVGVSNEWLQQHGLSGFAAHWQKNSNVAWAFDTWFLNKFPRTEPFVFNKGGYATLSFLPTLATMTLGLLAGGLLKSPRTAGQKLGILAIAGVVLMATGWSLGALGVCPIVKRIWTPSWVLYSGGGCCLFLAGFYALADVARQRWIVFPLMVIGINSIATYLMAQLFKSFITKNVAIHIGQENFQVLGPTYETVLHGLAVLLVFWLLLYGMYRKKIFLKV